MKIKYFLFKHFNKEKKKKQNRHSSLQTLEVFLRVEIDVCLFVVKLTL